jgi:hypothetical protein
MIGFQKFNATCAGGIPPKKNSRCAVARNFHCFVFLLPTKAHRFVRVQLVAEEQSLHCTMSQAWLSAGPADKENAPPVRV